MEGLIFGILRYPLIEEGILSKLYQFLCLGQI